MVSSIVFREPEKPARINGSSDDSRKTPLANIDEDASLGTRIVGASASGEKTTTSSKRKKGCQTIPNWETEFHQAIHRHDWDELEHLLKEHDLKKYKGPTPKKNKRRLRVAKYLPELPWHKEEEIPQNPLYGLDELGRTPLHLCCINPVPTKLLIRLLFVARDVASVPDQTGSLPLHLAVIYERNVDVIDKLIRGYFQASWTPDISGNTPLMWAIDIVQKLQEEENKAASGTFWGFPARRIDQVWQQKQEKLWKTVEFLLENRHARRQQLIPQEYGQVKRVFGLGAPPKVAELIIITGQKALKMEAIVAPSIFLCIRRQYPLEILQQMIDGSPRGLARVQKDSAGRGLVAVHYKVGCTVHNNLGQNRQSFRMIMERMTHRVHSTEEEEFVPPPSYLDWWGKLKFLIGQWGSHADRVDDDSDSDGSKVKVEEDDLLLHRALSNPDCPPSLVRLLAVLNPSSAEVLQPVSGALPIHLACRVWRYRHYPPRPDENEMPMERVLPQLLDRDLKRSRMRYHDRLPLHHAIAAGKNWLFLSPLFTRDKKSLLVRDPMTRLYPFQLAASYPKVPMDMTKLALRKFSFKEWNKMKDYQKDHQLRAIDFFYDLEQLSVIFEALRNAPATINHDALVREKPQMRNPIVMEDVVSITQMKMVRAKFGLGNVAGHFIAWGYENTEKGWKTHRRNFAVIKTAIMDGFIPAAMDKWWRKLKFWIWHDCPWKEIPRRDEFLLHGAVCNPDVSPWIVALLVECFPRSTSIPLPKSDGCYPLHIACSTARYISLSWEFPNRRTTIELVSRTYPDAILRRWKAQLPLHLAIGNSKGYEEIKFMVETETILLAMPDPITKLFPFQLMAVDRAYTPKQRQRFEAIARKAVGAAEWKSASPQAKVIQLSTVLRDHETGIVEGIWELLRRNADFVGNDGKEGIADLKPHSKLSTSPDLSTQTSLRLFDLAPDSGKDHGILSPSNQLTRGSLRFEDLKTEKSFSLLGSRNLSRQESLRIGDLIFDENQGSKKMIESANLSLASLNFLEATYDKESSGSKTWRVSDAGGALGSIAELSLNMSDISDGFKPVKALLIQNNLGSIEESFSDLEDDEIPEIMSRQKGTTDEKLRDSHPWKGSLDQTVPVIEGAELNQNTIQRGENIGNALLRSEMESSAIDVGRDDEFKPVEAVDLGNPLANAEESFSDLEDENTASLPEPNAGSNERERPAEKVSSDGISFFRAKVTILTNKL